MMVWPTTIWALFFMLPLPAVGQGPADNSFQYYVKLAKTAQADRPRRNRQIKWIGAWTDSDKHELINFMDTQQNEFTLYSATHVLKEDIDGNGNLEYLANLLIRVPKVFYYGEMLCILIKRERCCEVIPVDGPADDTGIDRKIQAVDLDGDGFKEIVDQRVYDIGGDEEANHYAIILKNDRGRFHRVYQRHSNAYLAFQDLDNDGAVEILETINEYGLPIGPVTHWINIYNLKGSMLELASPRYVGFYRQRRKEYEEFLSKELPRIVLRSTPEYGKIEKALRAYIKRIDDMATGSK